MKPETNKKMVMEYNCYDVTVSVTSVINHTGFTFIIIYYTGPRWLMWVGKNLVLITIAIRSNLTVHCTHRRSLVLANLCCPIGFRPYIKTILFIYIIYGLHSIIKYKEPIVIVFIVCYLSKYILCIQYT